ncbi:hypothetical protein JCM10213_005455 [Rhodosporidiobolus nylandii]
MPPPATGAPHPLASLSAAAAAHAQSSHTAYFTPHPPPTLSQAYSRASGSGGAYTASPEAASPSYASPGEGAGPSKKRRVTAQHEGGDASPVGERPPAHPLGYEKKRTTLSCTECKCDRKIPCLACCKRGEPGVCTFSEEVAPKDPDVQPFALTADLVRLASRLQALEEWAGSLPTEIRARAPPPQPQGFEPETYGVKVKQSTRENRGYASGSGAGKRERDGSARSEAKRGASGMEDELHPEAESGAPSREMSDTEDAAVKLENVAFTSRVPGSGYRPQDSLPFFDNPSSLSAAQSAHLPPRASVAFPPAELTSMLTSIVAPPLVYDGPFSSSSLGLGLCFSLEELRVQRSNALRGLWQHLPEKALSMKLVEKYFIEVDFLHNVFHRKSFMAELERAWEMIEAGRREEIDSMWLAGYCMVLALSIDGLRCQEARIAISEEEQKCCRPLVWYACAQRFMQLGDGTGRPQVRFIQTVILIGQWLQCSSVGGQASRFLSLLASAIRAAQILGLHQLSDDPSHMPPPDPAWPPNACSLRRETALRLFGLLSFLDFMSATTRFRCYAIDPQQTSTPPVSNLNLDQLSTTEWRIEPHPRTVLTDSSFEYAKWCMCRTSREVFTKLIASTSSFSYETVLELDDKYRKALTEIESALPSTGQSADEPSQRWKRLICQEAVHSRIVRLHRPFMLKNEYSRKCCLESAELVIRADLAVMASTNNAWFTYSHALAAAICLFSDLFHAIDSDRPEKEIERKKDILVLAFEVFGRFDEIQNVQLKYVVQTGLKILSGLFMAEEKRRVTRAATALVGGARSNEPPPESFAAVLQRLTQEVAAQPPPTSSPAPPLPASLPPAQPFAPGQCVPYAGFPPFAPAGPASNSASIFSSAEQPASGVPFDFAFPGSSETYGTSEFFRDVGLVGSSSLGLGSFDALSGYGGAAGGHGVPHATAVLQTEQPPPFGAGGTGMFSTPGGASNPFYAPAPGMDWTFDGGMAGDSGDTSKLAATALLDQLSGGVW